MRADVRIEGRKEATTVTGDDAPWQSVTLQSNVEARESRRTLHDLDLIEDEAAPTTDLAVNGGAFSRSALVDVDGAAQHFGCSPGLVGKLRSECKLSSVQLGRSVRFRREDLDAYILANLRPSKTTASEVSGHR